MEGSDFLMILVTIGLVILAYLLVVWMMSTHIQSFLFRTKPPCSKREDDHVATKIWKWIQWRNGVRVWDTGTGSDPTKPILVVATGLWINAYDQRHFMKWLVKYGGYRVIVVFYRLFEEATLETRVKDFQYAYDHYLYPRLLRRNPPDLTYLGISYGCTVLTEWLLQIASSSSISSTRLVLLHPVQSFWKACRRLVPGMKWFPVDGTFRPLSSLRAGEKLTWCPSG